MPSTSSKTYTKKLLTHETCWWKKLFNVQAPYRWNIRRLKPGFTLEIGCGLGRMLSHLDGHGVGIDHNKESIRIAHDKGLTAYTPDEFALSRHNKNKLFDSMLLSHVVEHLGTDASVGLILQYKSLIKDNGQLILITPQEAGYFSDETHIEFMNFTKLQEVAVASGFQEIRHYSFPFPRFIGNIFKYNEFISIGSLRDQKHPPTAINNF
nr:methyltransferase domain-containing protein [Desulfobulbaceae bacterium]